jgi:tetratricopeptide (TPR) repeat protein
MPMRALKVVVALLLVMVSATVAFRVVLPTIRCNAEKARVNTAMMIRDRARSSYDQTRRARRNAAACLRCLESFPNDAEFRMLLAANQHVIGIHDEAERNYRRALELNDRAETYAFLALLQLDLGRVEEARQNLYHACIFDISLVELVSSPMREEIYEAVMQRHEKLRGGSRPTN